MVYVVIFIIFALAFWYFGEKLFFSSLAMGNKILPQRKITSETKVVPSSNSAYCPHCGKPFSDGDFCSVCGTSKVRKERLELSTNGRMSATKFEKALNNWLAENPYVTDVKLNMETGTSFISFMTHNRICVRDAVIEYRVDSKPQNYQYGVAFAYNCRMFGSLGYSYKKHIEKWSRNNADCAIVSTHGSGRIQHWSNNGDFHAEYYSFILFKKPITC